MFGIRRVAQRVASARTATRSFVAGPPPGEAALSYTAQVAKKIRLVNK